MAPPPLPKPHLKLFYVTSSWIIAVLAVLVWHPVISATVYLSIVFALLAFPLSQLTPKVTIFSNLRGCIKLWIYQSIALLSALCFAAIWFHQFPAYGFYKNDWVLHHLSLNFFISTLVLANILIVLVNTAQQTNNQISLLPLYKDEDHQSRSLSYKNFAFRRGLMLTVLLLFLLDCFYFLSRIHFNLLSLVCSSVVLIYFVRSQWLYAWLQKCIKRRGWNFLFFLLLLLAAVILLSTAFNWFIAPVFTSSPLNFFPVGSDAPLIVFWGYAICTTIPLSFLLAPKLLRLSPPAILFACVFNPFIWLTVLFDAEFNLLDQLSHLSNESLFFIASVSLIASAWWLSSHALAKLNTQMLFSPNQYRGGPMPRLFVQSHLAFTLLLIGAIALKAIFWLQVEFLSCAVWAMVSDSFLIGFFWTHFRKTFWLRKES